jgi:enamine deaminase RidA (YjgF/YER057c/UK114 family)
MNSNNVTRRNFGSALAAIFSGAGIASLFSRSASAAPATTAPQAAAAGGVVKLSYDGKPTDGKSFITPLVIFNSVIYIAGQGAHSHDSSTFDMDITLHTTKVMDNVKNLVEAGGGTMDSILQLTVFLSTIDNYDGMNKARSCICLAGRLRASARVGLRPER